MMRPRLLLLLSLAAPCALAHRQDDISRLQSTIEQLSSTVTALRLRVEQLEQKHVPAVVPREASTVVTAPKPERSENVSPGRLAFNGEFRLYFDSVTRHAGGGAPRVSNIRGRYLLHLDFDARLHRALNFHGRLSTGPLNNPLTDIQDFGGGVAKNSFLLSEAYMDYHPNASVRLQGGRVDNPFNDRSRFLFDTDTRFNGTNEIFRWPMRANVLGLSHVQLMAGQYTFSNPNFPIIDSAPPSVAANATPSQALLAAGAKAGTQPRASQLFQQGVMLDGKIGNALTQQAGFDFQLYRNPNQLRLMSTPGGLFLLGGTVGLTPSSPVPSASNATTTPGGATLTAPGFRVAHLSYTIAHDGVTVLDRRVPVSLNLQMARNVERVSDRNAFSAIATAGRNREPGDLRFLYAFYRKQANSLIGELTENDIAIGGNVNMDANLLRMEYTMARSVVFVNNFIFTRWLTDSNPQAGYFVPFGRSVPLQFRYQGMLIFRF